MNYFDLLDRLEGLYERNRGRQFTPSQLTYLVARNVPFRDVVFTTNLTINCSLNSVVVSGLYDYGEDRWGYRPIEIELAYFKRKKHFVLGQSMTWKTWQRLCFDVASVLGHEYVHLRQYRDRDYRPGRGFRSRETDRHLRETQEYLGHTDEIDAYGFTCAAEMAMSLRLSKPVDFLTTSMYNHYCEAFGADHSIITKLQQKTIK